MKIFTHLSYGKNSTLKRILQVNLSGGQKARGKFTLWDKHYVIENESAPVSLARAVYSRASILLLDDVLSAGKYHGAHNQSSGVC